MYCIVLFCLPVCVPASFFIHFLTCLVSWMRLYGLPIPSTFFFFSFDLKKLKIRMEYLSGKTTKHYFWGGLWQQKSQSLTFLVQLEGVGIRTAKMLYFIVWCFFSTSDMGMVLCMLSSRLTSVRFFWKVFEPYNDEVRQTQLLSLLIHEKLYLFIHSCWLWMSNCP